MGFLRWESIKIKLGDEFIGIYEDYEKEWEWQAQPETQTPKGFTFERGLKKDLTGGILVAKGVYSSHQGKGMMLKTWETHLKGMLKPIEEE